MNNNLPFISVVMCSYNTKSFIEKAVNSILDQSYKNWELIIIDDCSTDGTREWLKILENNKQVRLFLQEENAGYVASKNFGISQARGNYISQCDSDDYFDVNLLEKQVEVIINNTDINIVACGFHYIDMNGNIRKTVKPENNEIIENNASNYHPFWYPPILVHKKVYDKIGYFTSYFLGLGDDLYWLTKANEHFKIHCINNAFYYYRYNPNSISKNLNDPKKITRPLILKELLKQRREKKTDWLDNEEFDLLDKYEKKLLSNKKFMSNNFIKWSRTSIDYQNWREAESLTFKAIKTDPSNFKSWKIILYYLKKRFLRQRKT